MEDTEKVRHKYLRAKKKYDEKVTTSKLPGMQLLLFCWGL
jgi:hypothetical protein